MEAISAKFSNYGQDPKNVFRPKMMARTNHLYHHAKFGGNRATHVGVRGWDVMFFTFYRQDLPQAALPVFRLLTGRFWGFSQGRHVAPIKVKLPMKVKFGREVGPLLPAKFDLGSGVGV